MAEQRGRQPANSRGTLTRLRAGPVRAGTSALLVGGVWQNPAANRATKRARCVPRSEIGKCSQKFGRVSAEFRQQATERRLAADALRWRKFGKLGHARRTRQNAAKMRLVYLFIVLRGRCLPLAQVRQAWPRAGESIPPGGGAREARRTRTTRGSKGSEDGAAPSGRGAQCGPAPGSGSRESRRGQTRKDSEKPGERTDRLLGKIRLPPPPWLGPMGLVETTHAPSAMIGGEKNCGCHGPGSCSRGSAAALAGRATPCRSLWAGLRVVPGVRYTALRLVCVVLLALVLSHC